MLLKGKSVLLYTLFSLSCAHETYSEIDVSYFQRTLFGFSVRCVKRNLKTDVKSVVKSIRNRFFRVSHCFVFSKNPRNSNFSQKIKKFPNPSSRHYYNSPRRIAHTEHRSTIVDLRTVDFFPIYYKYKYKSLDLYIIIIIIINYYEVFYT